MYGSGLGIIYCLGFTGARDQVGLTEFEMRVPGSWLRYHGLDSTLEVAEEEYRV